MKLPTPVHEALRRTAIAAQQLGQVQPPFCLVTGAPRSATTAVGNWLLTIEGVKGAGESRILLAAYAMLREARRFRSLSKDEAQILELTRALVYGYYGQSRVLVGTSLLIDKEPFEPIGFPDGDYAAFLRSIEQLMPGMRIVFMLRDPVATIWSMTQRKWGYSLAEGEPRDLSLEQHIATWVANAELIEQHRAHANAYVCHYERLVADPVQESAKLCAFLGLKTHSSFEPRKGKDSGFGEAELAQIRAATSKIWGRLSV